LLFADHTHRHLFNNGPATPDASYARYKKLADQVELAIIAESARWGDMARGTPYTQADWRSMRDYILGTYMPQRPAIVLSQLRGAGLYPSVIAPVFYVNGVYKHGGYVQSGSQLTMTPANATIYYTLDGSDPRLIGGSVNPKAVNLQTGTSGGQVVLVAESASKRVLVPSAAVSDNWKGGQAFDDSSWTAGTGGVGYERSSGYETFIGLNMQQQMYNKAIGCFVRIPFTVTAGDLSAIKSLTMKMRYDDGFVAYINGVEVLRALFTGTPAWNSPADNNYESTGWEPFDITKYIYTLRQGQNILAIHAMNYTQTSSDFLISAELDASTAGQQSSSITLTKSTQVKSRVLSGTTWSALNEAVFAVGPVAENLRISEIMYHPQDTNNPDDPNTEYIELKNIGAQTINLNLVKFTNGIDFTFGDINLAPNKYILVVKDLNAFTTKYGQGLPIAGTYTGSLDNAGEKIELQDAVGKVIHDFKYSDGWYEITDGIGFSLTVKDPATIPSEPNALDDKALWRPSANTGGSPGYDDTGTVPALGSVVINELLAHSHAAGADWIELYNTTNQTINIGGWFLSDDPDNLTKYTIAQGTVIGAYGYKMFYEDQNFGNLNDPGCKVPFALSENGETLCLQSGSNGVITGYSEQEKFDASQTGVSLGRYLKSTEAYNFVALSKTTPGNANAYPLVGPVVINEIMYHPDGVDDAEYVELLNMSGGPVTLYDANDGVNEAWRFTDDPDNPGIDFRFAKDSPVTLNAGEYLLLVKDITLFSSKYTVPQGVKVFSWGAGKLDNAGEKIQLSKPGDIDLQGTRHWIRVDRVVYSDGAHPDNETGAVDPWPVDADGLGKSLSRKYPQYYGNDPNNWQAATPTPGGENL
jgi:hypothetical protein